MKKFFKEFKQFISRGNIIDLAVGVIIGGAFSAIVTSLTNKILMPVINLIVFACTGGTGINLITVLNGQDYLIDIDGVQTINPACIYIDWGDFIQVILNFLLIALVIFLIMKAIMKSQGFLKDLETKAKKDILTKEQIKELKANKIKLKDKAAVKAFLDAKQKELEEKQAEEEARKKAEEEANRKPTTEELLSDIKELLAKQSK